MVFPLFRQSIQDIENFVKLSIVWYLLQKSHGADGVGRVEEGRWYNIINSWTDYKIEISIFF